MLIRFVRNYALWPDHGKRDMIFLLRNFFFYQLPFLFHILAIHIFIYNIFFIYNIKKGWQLIVHISYK